MVQFMDVQTLPKNWLGLEKMAWEPNARNSMQRNPRTGIDTVHGWQYSRPEVLNVWKRKFDKGMNWLEVRSVLTGI